MNRNASRTTRATMLPTGRSVQVSDPYGQALRSGLGRPSDKLVVMTEDDCAAIVRRAEDAEDATALRAAVASTSRRDYLPASFVARLVAGESPVRVWREHRRLSQRTLAARIAVDVGELTRIEANDKHCDNETLTALADALDVEMDDLS